MNGIRISKLEEIGENDSGQTFGFENQRTGQFLLGQRNAGSISGRHFHQGKSPGKNPEILLLVSGKAEIFCRDIQTGEEMRQQVSAPARIEISPNIWHELHAITDITFLEFNSLKEHQQDTKYNPAINGKNKA